MKYLRITTVLLAFAASTLVGPELAGTADAEAKPAKAREQRAKSHRSARRAKRKRRRAGRRICRRKDGRRRCRWVPMVQGHNVAESKLRTEPLPTPSGKVDLFAVNFREEVEVEIYADDGELDEAALAELDHGFRCKRTKDERAVDPRLYEILSIIYDEFGHKRIELVSGFRFQRNESSRHYHAAAMDIRIPGVPARKLFEFAKTLDTGGMGIGWYPRSNFVHIDFRAPGEPSYRWIDRSGPSENGKGKRPSRKWSRKKKPTS